MFLLGWAKLWLFEYGAGLIERMSRMATAFPRVLVSNGFCCCRCGWTGCLGDLSWFILGVTC